MFAHDPPVVSFCSQVIAGGSSRQCRVVDAPWFFSTLVVDGGVKK